MVVDLDVYQATVVACVLIVRKDRKVQKQLRTFGTTTRTASVCANGCSPNFRASAAIEPVQYETLNDQITNALL
jgi:hypothetical protein